MKHILCFLSIGLFLTIVSCQSDPSTPMSDGSILIVQPDTLSLAKTDSLKMLDLKLSCGCGFTLQVTSMTGDTSIIKYSPLEQMDDILPKHSIRFSYSPSHSPLYPQPVTLTFLARKHSYTYTNSVSVKISN